jgi:hypothetical protein
MTRTPLTALLVALLLSICASPLLSACTATQKSGLITERDDARGRTRRFDPRNQLEGTSKSTPTWVNPGAYFYDDNTTVFFVEIKVQSNNIPMKLRGASLILGGNRVFLDRCAPTTQDVLEDGNTKVFTEYSECRIEKEIFKKIGDASEVRVIFEGEKERAAFFSSVNRERFKKFFSLMTKPAKKK